MTNNNIIQSAYYNKCNISVNGTGEAKTDDGEAQSDSAKIADKEDSAVDCEDSDRNIEAQPHLIHDEGHSGTKLSPDGSTPDSLVALDGKDNSSNADLVEDQSDSTKDPGGTCGDISCDENRAQDFDGPTGLSASLQFPPGGGEGPIHDQPPSVPPPLGGWVTLHQEGQSGSANDTGGTAGAISYKTGVTCENTGAEDKSDTAKDVESIDQTKCHKGANGNVGDASSEEAAEACLPGMSHDDEVIIPDDLQQAQAPAQAPAPAQASDLVPPEGQSHKGANGDDKVIIPDDLFPRTLKRLIDAIEAHEEKFTEFAHVFDDLTGLEIMEHDQKDTPVEKAWKHIRVAGWKALEVCVSERLRNDSSLASLMPSKKVPLCMRDITTILHGLTKTEQFKHDPFLIVTITYKHIHSIDSEDWVSALKVIFAQQPVPFSFVETPNPTKKTTKHSILHIAHLGKQNLIKTVQRLENKLSGMTVRTRRKCDEEDLRKTNEWKTVELSVLNLPDNMGKTGVLAIEPHMFESWKQKLAVQNGGGVRDLATQSEAARLVFQLAKSAGTLENVMHLLTSAFREQRCLSYAAAIAVVDMSHVPRDSGDKYHGTSAAITPATMHQTNLLNNSVPWLSNPQGNGRDMLNYPQGNDRDMYQVQGAQNSTAFTQGTVTNRSGRHVPGPSAPHNFSPETPNVAGTPDFDSIRDVLFFDDTFASFDVDVSPLPHRERTTEVRVSLFTHCILSFCLHFTA